MFRRKPAGQLSRCSFAAMAQVIKSPGLVGGLVPM
jgi:hypothetical protein